MILQTICNFLDERPGQFFSLEYFVKTGINKSSAYKALKKITYYEDYQVKIILNPKTQKQLSLYGKSTKKYLEVNNGRRK